MFFFFLVLSLLNSNLFQLATYTEYKKTPDRRLTANRHDHGALIDLQFQRQYQHLDEWKRPWQTVGIKGGGGMMKALRPSRLELCIGMFFLSFFLVLLLLNANLLQLATYMESEKKKKQTTMPRPMSNNHHLSWLKETPPQAPLHHHLLILHLGGLHNFFISHLFSVLVLVLLLCYTLHLLLRIL